MQCRICKKHLSRKRGHFFITHWTKRGDIRYIRWCHECNENKPKEVDDLHRYVEEKDEEWRAEKTKLRAEYPNWPCP